MTIHVGLPYLRDSSPGRLEVGAGLTRAERFTLAVAAWRLPGNWFTREHHDQGRAIALVLPRDEWDQQLPVFLIWRGVPGLIHLCMARGSEAVDLGCFAGITDVVACLKGEVRRHVAVRPIPMAAR